MYILIAQLVASIVLIGLILLQDRSSGTGGLFGGAQEGGSYQTRRGIERVIYWITVGIAALFAALSVVSLILK